MDDIELRQFKEIFPNFGVDSHFGKQILTSWVIKNRTIPQYWKEMAKAILGSV